MQLYVINPPARPVILHCPVLQAGPENAPPALSCNLLAAFGEEAEVIAFLEAFGMCYFMLCLQLVNAG